MSAVWLIFRKEWLDVVRDRRAVFLAFVLPVVLYPALYLSVAAASRSRTESSPLRVGVSGDYLDLVPILAEQSLAAEERPMSTDEVRNGDVALIIDFQGSKLTVFHSATSTASAEALRRARLAADAFRESLLRRRFAEARIGVDPLQVARVEVVDVSSGEERSAAKLGRFLPLLLVILLLTGGSFAALDLVAGEKERGTLETLFIHPIAGKCIVRGKFLVVLGLSVVSLVFNLAGLYFTVLLGGVLGLESQAVGVGGFFVPPPGALVLVFVVTLPLAVLTSAILISLSAFARSFREAQTYLLPTTLAALALCLLAVAPHATLSSVVAIVPVANAGLALREAVEGKLLPVPFAVAFLSSCGYAWLALRKATSLLEREDLVLGLEPPALLEDATAEGRWRRAIAVATVYLLFLYFAASWIQSVSPLVGLAVTLWVLVLVPALAYPAIVKASWRETLGLRRPPLRSVAAAPCIAVSAAVVMGAYMVFQDQFLPEPPGLKESLQKLLGAEVIPDWVGLLLFSISPGICEELLWRGAFQGELEHRRKPIRTVCTVALFFGIFHFSAYRLVPTAALGALFAVLRWRTGSIVPCMLVHALYNGCVIFGAKWLGDARLEELITSPSVVLAAAAILLLSVRLALPRPPVRGM